MNIITSTLAVFLAAAAIADANGNIRRLGSKGSKVSRSKATKASYSYSMSMSKAGKGSKSSKAMSMSYPPRFDCKKVDCTMLPASCTETVLYVVDVVGYQPFQQQGIAGVTVGDFDTKAAAEANLVEDRDYVPASPENQNVYSCCWEGSGDLVEDPVWFPPAGQAECSN